jgi:outer membrane protein
VNPSARILLVLVCALPPYATAEDLLEVYRQALDKDPAFGAARAAYTANIEQAPQGRAGLLPTIGLSASTTYYDQEAKITTTNQYNYNTDSYSLSLTQPLYRKQNFAAAEQGRLGADQAGYDLTTARHDLILRVALAYLGVLLAEDIADFATAEKVAIERLAKLTQRNFSVGTASLVDVHDTKAALDLAVAEEIAARNDIERTREVLRALIGAPTGRLARLADRFEPQPPQPDNIENWIALAEANNPQIKSSERTHEIAAQELEKSRGGHHPTLDLTAAHTWSDAGGSTQGFALESTTNQIGVVFQLPLYAGGGTESKVRESYARRDEAAQRLEQTRRVVSLLAREAWLAVLNSIARVRSLEAAAASNQRALESSLLGYERGLRNGQDVLINQRTLFRTRRDLSQARYDFLIARLRLKSATGTLAGDDLAEINRLLK